jgi:primase-polymerase (primpol)-like protein
MEKNFTKHTDEMNSSGKDYFEEWQKEGDKYKNHRIQQLSEQRRFELSRIYGEIATNSIGVKEGLNSYISDLKEIQRYLSNDLTPKGIHDIEPLAREVAGKNGGLKYEIENVQAAVNRANAAMAQ